MTHVIGYSPSRFAAVDYSPPLGPFEQNWISRLPRKLPPYTNLIKTFDKTTWILIGLSISSFVDYFSQTHRYTNAMLVW